MIHAFYENLLQPNLWLITKTPVHSLLFLWGIFDPVLRQSSSLTSSFFLMAEIFVKLGEQICACDESLDTGVLALRPMGGLRAELLCLLASSLARPGVLPASSCTKAFTLVLARPSGRWNKTHVRRSLAAPLFYLSAHRPVMFICHEWASALGSRDFIWSKFSKLALREKSTVS